MTPPSMPVITRRLPEQLRELPARDRFELACALWDSLTEEQRVSTMSDPDGAWGEIQRRLRALESGDTTEISQAELMNRVERALNWKSEASGT